VAVQTILVCDYCGKPAVDTASVKVGGGSWVLDLCADHVTEVTSHARRARPGRRPGPGPTKPATRRPRAKAKSKAKTSRTRRRARVSSTEVPPTE
jgi:hypothetical protein